MTIPPRVPKTFGGSKDMLVPNEAQLREFFSKTTPDQIHLTAIRPDGRDIIGRDFGTNVDDAISWAIARNADGINVHFTVNRVKGGINRKPKKIHVDSIRFIHVDIDPPKDGSAWNKKTTLKRLMETSPPSIVIDSGNGLQALWRVTEATIEQAEAINRSLINKYDGDRGTHNADRLLRVPGLINYPNTKKIAAGRKPVLASIAKNDDGTVYSAVELIDKLGSEIEAVKGERKADATAAIGHYNLSTSDDLGLAAGDHLRHLIDKPKGYNRSGDVFHCACEMGRRGYTREQIVGVLLNPENAINAHCADQADPERAAIRAIDEAFARDDVARRRQQRERTRKIGDGSDHLRTTELFTLDEMLERFVYIRDGAQVADRLRPQSLLLLKDFKTDTAGSIWANPATNPPKFLPYANLWLKNSGRLDAETVTFRAGAGEMTEAPDGRHALNLFKQPVRPEAPDDRAEQAQFFINHIVWLFGEYGNAFLDWLAHIEQKPGDLPHFGWLHISKVHGKGRNWISDVLARLWRGNVAASFDLVSAMDNGFNGRLSRIVLAIVDEIHEGGNSTYRHAQTLRQMVTAKERLINPKYGRQRVEWNAARWLIFSNHAGAIPLGDDDRRFFVVDHDGPVRSPKYYRSLYAKVDDPGFIASVADFLKHRDISGFNPGALPPLTQAKKALIAATRSDSDMMLEDIVDCWPVDVISWEELKKLMLEHTPKAAAARHVLDRAGLVKVGKFRLPNPGCSDRPNQTPIYAIRNHGDWTKASPDALRKELNRLRFEEKENQFLNDTCEVAINSDLP